MPGILLVAILAVGLAGVMAWISRHPWAIREFEGGTYLGRIPGAGEVRLHRFVESGSSDASTYLVDSASGRWAWVSEGPTSEGNLWGPARSAWGSNIIFSVSYSGDDDSAMGSIESGTNIPAAGPSRTRITFPLRREYRHQGIQGRAGLSLGRYGARMSASGQFPRFDESDPFGAALNPEMVGLLEESLEEFLAGSLEQQWDALRWGWPASMADWSLQQQFQVRLTTSNAVSLALFTHPDRGGSGNPTTWSGLNYVRKEGGADRIALDQLFRSGTDWKAFLIQSCNAQLTRQRNIPTEIDGGSESDFTVTTDGLQILFDPYVVGSGAEGAMLVHIPWQDLRPWVKADLESTLGIRFP